MAAPRIEDMLQNYAFWLTDVEPTLQPPFFAFDLTLGFSAISAPEIRLDTDIIVDGTYSWKRKVVGKASAGSMTLTRGCRWWDSDFWRWIEDAIEGTKAPRKTLVLYHLLPAPTSRNTGFVNAAGNILQDASGGNFSVGDDALPLGVHDSRALIARAWVLFDCIPSGLRAGDGFDAMNSNVSIKSLEIEVERIEQLDFSKRKAFSLERYNIGVDGLPGVFT